MQLFQIETLFRKPLVSELETMEENNSRRMKNLFILILSLSFLVGCATDQKDQFEKVQVGMEKNDVLGLLDSPQRTQRWHGKDRWTYIFYDDNNRIEKEVHFLEGKAQYVGDVYKPEVSAEEQDRINEASNREVDAQMQAKHQENRKAFQDYESQSKGQDGIRYVPQYTPIQ
jgi:outer membrane protein assembly factor BamE